jgi:2-C-methyl-D-erythritol 4-phosphate cytidylyltransferase
MGSVQNALKAVGEDVQSICMHGSASPCIQPSLISEVVKMARRDGAAVAAMPANGKLLRVGKGAIITEALDANELWSLQTPAACRLDWLQQSLGAAAKKKKYPEDLVEAMAALKKPVRLVANGRPNIQLRQPTDLMMALALLT